MLLLDQRGRPGFKAGAERLRARAMHARLFAARERNRAAIYRAYAGLPAPGGRG
jgi:hypothetical protein